MQEQAKVFEISPKDISLEQFDADRDLLKEYFALCPLWPTSVTAVSGGADYRQPQPELRATFGTIARGDVAVVRHDHFLDDR